ncbi:snapalysin family zinc-dependent metalloprotease, partial [Streptomyces sp. NPDC057757]
MKRSVLSATLGLALAAGLAVLPTTAAAAAPAAPAVQGYTASTYAGSAQEAADNQAFFQAVMASAKAKQAASPGLATVVVTYDASSAPSFRNQIANAAQIWNGSVGNVR